MSFRQTRWAIGPALVALTALLLFSRAAHADVSVKVFPTYLEFTGDAGASTSQVLNIANEGTDSANVSIGAGAIRSAKPEDSAVTWLSTDLQHVILKPGESQNVTVTIRIPKDAKPGGHFAALYVHASAAVSGSDLGARGAGTGVGTSILSSFLITVRSSQPADLKLEAAVVKVVPMAVGEDKLGFRVEVQNNGNVHFVPKGELELTDLAGNKIGVLSLPEVTPVLPGATRSYTFSGALNVKPGDYKAEAKVDYSWQDWQAELAKTNPEEWAQKEQAADRTFNSEPKLRIASVNPIIQPDGTVRMDVQVENYGDVEVSPQGYVDFVSGDTGRVFALPLGSANTWVEPNSSLVLSNKYVGVLPKGGYTAKAVMNYHGEAEVQKAESVRVAQDVVPPAAPDLPPERRAELSIVRGVQTWMMILIVAIGVVAAVALTLAVQKLHLLAKAAALVKRRPPSQ